MCTQCTVHEPFLHFAPIENAAAEARHQTHDLMLRCYAIAMTVVGYYA